MHYLKGKVLDESLKSLEADSCAADFYLSRSDLIKFIEEARIANTNQWDMELRSNGL